MFGSRAVFGDVGPELTDHERARALRMARRAAVESQDSLTLTARRQYRRYRATVGERFLSWPEWHAEYVEKYRSFRSYFNNEASSSMD